MSKNNRNNRGGNRGGGNRGQRVLDFNVERLPVLSLVMRDDAQTRIDVTTPTEGLYEELRHIAPKLNGAAKEPDSLDAQESFELAARLISCNQQGLRVTAEDLAGKYRFNLESLILFYGAYVRFVDEVVSIKN